MEKVVMELIAFLQKWGLWRDVTIYADGMAYSYSDETRDTCMGLSHVMASVCEHPEEFTKGLLDLRNGGSNLTWKSYSNPEHILDMTFEGALYMLLRHDTYEGVRKEDISPEAWEYIFAHTELLQEFMSVNYDCASPAELLEKIKEDTYYNPDYSAWDPLAYDTWKEYQTLMNGEAYPDGEELLTPSYQRYGTYQEYVDAMERSEELCLDDVEPLWEKMRLDAKEDFVHGGEDESVCAPEIAGYLRAEFPQIFDRNGLWYDFGFGWSLTCYKKEDVQMENKMKEYLGSEYSNDHLRNFCLYWMKARKGRGDAWRKKNDLDCLYFDGDLRADTLMSAWTPVKWVADCLNSEYDMKFYKRAKDKEDPYHYLKLLFDDRDAYLPRGHELVRLLDRFLELAELRCNYILLPDRRMNTARYKICIDGEEKWLFDEVPVMLCHLFDEKWFGRYFDENGMEATAWIKRERLEHGFYDGICDREHVIPLLKDLPAGEAKWLTDESEIKEALTYMVRFLELRQ